MLLRICQLNGYMSNLAYQGAAWGTWPNPACHQSLAGCQGLVASVGREGSGALGQCEEDGMGTVAVGPPTLKFHL